VTGSISGITGLTGLGGRASSGSDSPGGVGVFAADDEFIAADVTSSDLAAARTAGLSVVRRVRLSNIGIDLTVFGGDGTGNSFRKVDALRAARPRLVIAPNTVYSLNANLCSDGQCFGHQLVHWPSATSSCGQGLRVGIVDSKVDTGHRFLANADIASARFGKEQRSGLGLHGTAIALVLVGQAPNGVTGLVPSAKLYAADVFDRRDDTAGALIDALLSALDWLTGMDVHVINLSLSGPAHPLLERAVKSVAAKGIAMVAAAGNGGPNAAPAYPAAYDEVLSVTAVDRLMRPYRQANRGNYIAFAAPGVNLAVPSTNGRSLWSGTSFSSAYLTGLAAGIIADNRANTSRKIAEVLQKESLDLGAPGKDPIFGWGLARYRPNCAQNAPSKIAGERPTLPTIDTLK